MMYLEEYENLFGSGRITWTCGIGEIKNKLEEDFV